MQYQAEYTTSGTRSTSGDGTAVIAAPASDKLRWHITGLIIVAGDPGTSEVTATLKSGDVTKATFPINDTAAGYMSSVDTADRVALPSDAELIQQATIDRLYATSGLSEPQLLAMLGLTDAREAA